MQTLLQTKLYIPTVRDSLVRRLRLDILLNQASSKKLVLVTAPAGYGKTTLLAAWISQLDRPVAWLSLDADDNTPTRFLDYTISAVQRALPGFGREIPKVQRTDRSVSLNDLLAAFINETADQAVNIILILDDYHLIRAGEVHEMVRFLLDNAPPNLQIAIASRTDPPLGIPGLRASGAVLEIRAADLQFSHPEAVEFLQSTMELNLAPEDVNTLMAKTEGWIVGLQLAAISLQNHPDRHAFVNAFAGSDRFIADYLVEEALDRQPGHLQNFLMDTAFLDRLCAPLCDAVTDREDSQLVLDELERANLFLVPLDSQRTWYRYHHLFADLLRNHHRQTRDGRVQERHKKASAWYRENGLLPEAINHALAADEIDLLAQLTEEMAVYQMDAHELQGLKAWLDGLPESAFHRYPWLLVTRTWALFNIGDYAAVGEHLRHIKRILSTETVSSGLARRIRGHVAAIRSYYAELQEEDRVAIQQAEDALDLLPPKDVKLRAFVAIRWANCQVSTGNFIRAIPAYQEAGESARLAGDGQLAITALSELAIVLMLHGKLRQAVKSFDLVCDYAENLAQKDGRRLPAVGILYRHLSYLKRELNALPEAVHFARESVRICRQWGEKESLLFAHLALARARFSQGMYAEVDEIFERILQTAAQISPKAVDLCRNWVRHFQLLRGDLAETGLWVKNCGLSAEDEVEFDLYSEYRNLARYLAAVGEPSKALTIIDKLLETVDRAGAGIYTISYKVFKASVLDQMGSPDAALDVLAEALSLAQPEGYIRSILDEGGAIGNLLYRALHKGIYPAYCQKLLEAFSRESSAWEDPPERAGALVEPLSERELEVLAHIASGATNQEIALSLHLSLYTVKSHARNIYGKLGVKNRTEAVAKARLLGLLANE